MESLFATSYITNVRRKTIKPEFSLPPDKPPPPPPTILASTVALSPVVAELVAPPSPARAELPGIDIPIPTEKEAPSQDSEETTLTHIENLKSVLITLQSDQIFPDPDKVFAGENLSGGWWKVYDPPIELVLLKEQYPNDIMQLVNEWEEMVERIKNESSPLDDESITEEVESITDSIAQPPRMHRALELSAGRSQQHLAVPSNNEERRQRLLSHLPSLSISSVDSGSSSGSNYSDAVELETPQTSTPSVASNLRRLSINSVVSSKSSGSFKQSKMFRPRNISIHHEIVSMGSLSYSPYYTSLPKSSRMVGDKPKKAKEDPSPVAGLKKFLKERKAESECSSCMEDHRNTKLTTLPCQHKYCTVCLRTLITTSFSDPTLFPPRCCLSVIPVKICTSVLPRSSATSLKLKLRESLIPESERIYCPQPTCAVWIPPPTRIRNIEPNFPCPKCKKHLCRHCHAPAHAEGTECLEDIGLREVLNEAERMGWQRCYKCKALVEITHGCMHMKCRCKAEFCYVCGGKWKTCSCSGEELAEVQRRRREAVTITTTTTTTTGTSSTGTSTLDLTDDEDEDDEQLQLALEASRAEHDASRAEQDRRIAEEARRESEARERADALHAEALAQLKRRRLLELEQHHLLLQQSLVSLHTSQLSTMNSRHATILAEHRSQAAATRSLFAKEVEQEWTVKLDIQHKALAELKEQHTEEIRAVKERQEEDEDEYFFGVTTHLRGKPNREARTQTLIQKLQRTHTNELAAVERRQEEEQQPVNQRFGQVAAGMCVELREKERLQKQEIMGDWKRKILEQWAQRLWLQGVQEERKAGLQQIRETMIAQVLESTGRGRRLGSEIRGGGSAVELGV